MADALTWTWTPPTEPGWYWHRFQPEHRPAAVQVLRHSACTLTCDLRDVRSLGGEWAGPLTPPAPRPLAAPAAAMFDELRAAGGHAWDNLCPICGGERDAARDPAVVRLARDIYDARDWGSMGLLWDAIEAAGVVTEQREWKSAGPNGQPKCPRCHNSSQNGVPADAPKKRRCATCKTVWEPEAVTVPDETGVALRRHCLEPLHARGCWVLDMILGKE